VNHSALFGQIGHFIDIVVQVPRSDATRAKELLETLEERGEIVDEAPEARELELESRPVNEGEEPPPGQGPYRSAATEPRRSAPRLKRVAAFLSLAISFGTGHFYVRQTLAGSVLLLAQIGAFLIAANGNGAAMAAVPVLMLIDLVGSTCGAARVNAGKPLSAKAQLLRTLPAAAAALLLAALALPAIHRAVAPEPVETIDDWGDDAPYRAR
jgi:hypothetical protein